MIRRLAASDLVDGFDAGPSEDEAELAKFFRRFALKNQARRLSVTWVAIDSCDGIESIVGFVTTCPASVTVENLRALDHRLPGYPASVLLLARMATATTHRGRGVGKKLVQFVMQRAEDLANEHGCIGVLTQPKAGVAGFYEKLGFAPLAAANGPPMLCWLLPRK
jgi:predicted N-acetyltransferase YhbS